ncbi:MAG TPA: 4Fe-4S dicluster domain-containing protein [Anaerolineales bacterium]|nr:4Fe-4S dicluster domain-containing protein [Anaerolineales bacterium]
MRRIKIDVSRCTGCAQCMLSCSFKKTGAFDLSQSCIRILQWEDLCLSVPMVCQQCDDERCIWACPTDALTRHPVTGAILLDPTTCIRCELCRIECTYQVIHMTEDGLPMTCDLCDGAPACVAACYPGALTFVEAPDEQAEPFRPVVAVLNARGRGEPVEPPEDLKLMGDLSA